MAKGFSRSYYQKQHKKDVFWQILLPVGIGATAFLLLGIMAGLSLQTGTESAAKWGQIAVMWMILPVFVVGLALLILLSGLIFGIFKLSQIIPRYSGILLLYVERITAAIRRYLNKVASPFMVVQSNNAAVKSLILGIRYALLGGYNDKVS
jgi:hypothetical protein